jgi:hypothetical protein
MTRRLAGPYRATGPGSALASGTVLAAKLPVPVGGLACLARAYAVTGRRTV